MDCSAVGTIVERHICDKDCVCKTGTRKTDCFAGRVQNYLGECAEVRKGPSSSRGGVARFEERFRCGEHSAGQGVVLGSSRALAVAL
ncbi:hypothetical protein TNCT_722891 [Trichonephila clavata]|uniref:Uncharacterized protein n=1 Tax=Trichonephila clavata TaxID=2740835 RepID=A0A8X6HB37_TRICU|nr:hypothetical protein TNCT_722891 [Trichonephila clavata]